VASEVLGIDIGGVIISYSPDNFGVFHPVPGVFEALKRLKEEKFGEKIFIVSHAGESMERLMLWWLNSHDFYNITGIRFENVYFCRKRMEKARICKNFGVTHFIDDRKEILHYLHQAGIPNLYLFGGNRQEPEVFDQVLPHVTTVESYTQFLEKLLG